MSGREHKRLIVAVLIGALGGAGTLRLWEWTWRRAELLDMDPSHGNLKKQMKRRKSEAMQEVMDAVVQTEWSRAAEATERLNKYTASINFYLDTEVYDEHGAAFYGALRDLESAVGREDRVAAKEATLRLEQSCFDCHYEIHKPPEEPAMAPSP